MAYYEFGDVNVNDEGLVVADCGESGCGQSYFGNELILLRLFYFEKNFIFIKLLK